MQVFVACQIGNSTIEGFCELEEYEIDREIKKGSFSRNGKLPREKRSRLLLPDNIFKLSLGESYHFQIIGEPMPRYFPVTDLRNVAPYAEPYKMLPAEMFWLIELR